MTAYTNIVALTVAANAAETAGQVDERAITLIGEVRRLTRVLERNMHKDPRERMGPPAHELLSAIISASAAIARCQPVDQCSVCRLCDVADGVVTKLMKKTARGVPAPLGGTVSGYLGDPCKNCHHMLLKRTGTCVTCAGCGHNEGCG